MLGGINYVALLWGIVSHCQAVHLPFPSQGCLAKNQEQYHDSKFATFNFETYTYTTGTKAFKSRSAVSSLNGFPCFIFIGVPFWSVNPAAFPEEVKSEQTTIKLIEAARYQLRCGRPLRRILRWPCRTRARCYLSKFNLWPAAADPAAASLLWVFLIETLTQKHSRAWLPCWWKSPCCGSDVNARDWQRRTHLLHSPIPSPHPPPLAESLSHPAAWSAIV